MNEEFKPNTHVLTRLAEAFYENRSPKKTHLHFVSRTTWKSFLRYLDWLQSKNYVERKIDGSKKQQYRLTESGREMFDLILKFKEHVNLSKLLVS
jgi:predicted transcriptional regulator